MTLKNGFRIKVFVICYISQWMKRSKHDLFVPLRFPAKENPNMEMALFDLPIVLRYAVKAKVSIDFARLYPFDKPIKSLYFRLFVCFCFVRASLFQGHTKIALRHDVGDFAISWAGTARSADSITVNKALSHFFF